MAKGVFATRDGPKISSVTGDGTQICCVMQAGLDITRAILKTRKPFLSGQRDLNKDKNRALQCRGQGDKKDG